MLMSVGRRTLLKPYLNKIAQLASVPFFARGTFGAPVQQMRGKLQIMMGGSNKAGTRFSGDPDRLVGSVYSREAKWHFIISSRNRRREGPK